MQKLFFLIFISLTGVTLHSQDIEKYCESLYKQLDTIQSRDREIKILKEAHNNTNDLCKLIISQRIGNIYEILQKNDSAFYYYDSAIRLAKQITSKDLKSKELLAKVYCKKARTLAKVKRNIEAENLLKEARELLKNYPANSGWQSYYETYATISDNNAEHEKSLKYIDSTLIFSIRTNDTVDIPNNYHNKGLYLLRLSRYKESSENLLLALELKEKQENPSQLAATYFVLGAAYNRWEQLEVGIKYLNKAIIRAREEANDYTRLLSYSQLALIYRKLDDRENTLTYIDSTQVLAIKLDNHSQIAQSYVDKGWLYIESFRDYDKAEKQFLQAYEEAKIGNIDFTLYSSVRGIIESYLYKEEPQKAKKYFKPYQEVTKRIGTLRYLQEYHRNYSRYYEKTGQMDSAMKYLKKYYLIKDSIANTDVKTQVADLEKKYDTKAKELDIVNLTKEKEQQELIVQKSKTQQTIYLLVAGFLLVILAIGFWAFRKLRKQQQELTSTNQVKNRLFSIIAHDLRGMIIPFQRSGRILKHHIEKGNYDRTIELSQALEQNSESLSNMLDNLLNWSLQQMDGYRMNAEKISVKEELDVIKTMYEQQALFKNTSIELVYEKNLWVNFDKGAFNVIFRNLIGNALKYTEEGSIRIEFKNEFNVFLCSVTDTGIGMSQDQVNSLFTLDANTSTTGTKGEKGTGLGLNLVYRFIKMHNGVIEVSSEKRIGTRFEMKIPNIIAIKEDLETSDTLSA